MPPTISVTVGRLDAAAFDPVVLEPPELVELPELLQAARPAARAAALARLAILMRVGLDIEVLLVIGGGGGELGCRGLRRRPRRLRRVTAGARTAGGVPAGRSGPPRSAPGPR